MTPLDFVTSSNWTSAKVIQFLEVGRRLLPRSLPFSRLILSHLSPTHTALRSPLPRLSTWTPHQRLPGLTPEDHTAFHDPDSPLTTRLAVLRRLVDHTEQNQVLRMVLMGPPCAGKTSFMRAGFGEGAVEEEGEEGRTQGLTIRLLRVEREVEEEEEEEAKNKDQQESLPPMWVVWNDFGGHEQYYSIQAEFLSSDCVMVMTLNLKKAKDDMEASIDEMERWLDGVACTLEPGSSSAFVILGTHLDEVRRGCFGLDAVSSPLFMSFENR